MFDPDKAHSESPFERFYREQREKLDSEEQSKKFHEYHEESAKRSRDEYQAKNNKDAWAKIRDAGGVPRKRSQCVTLWTIVRVSTRRRRVFKINVMIIGKMSKLVGLLIVTL